MFSITTIVLMVLVYFGMMMGLNAFFVNGWATTKSKFLLADRQAGTIETSLSIVNTWTWAMALFVGPAIAYTMGWVGVAWFTIPNALSLVICGVLGHYLAKTAPTSFTLSSFFTEKYSRRVGFEYQAVHLIRCFAAILVQLTALNKIFAGTTSVPIGFISGGVVLATLIYSYWGGLKTSFVTGLLQMAMLFGILIVTIFTIFVSPDLTSAFVAGIYGKQHITDIFDLNMMLTFGLAFAVSVLWLPIGDPMFYQRIFALPKEKVLKTYLSAAAIFALIPIALGVIAMTAFGLNANIADPQRSQIFLLTQLFGLTGITIFSFILISKLGGTIDSAINAAGSIVANDWFKNNPESSVMASRITMAVLLLAAWGVSLMNFNLLYMFLIYSVFTVAMAWCTIVGITTDWLTERGIFYGILIGVVVGVGINVYATSIGNAPLKIAGPVSALLFSILCSLGISRFDKKTSIS